MKLLSFSYNGETHIGALNEKDRVIDLTLLGYPDSMNEIIAGGENMQKQIAETIADNSLPTLDMSSLEFANVTEPQKIVCVGLNYKNHAKETGAEIPKDIVFFSKFNDALTPASQSVKLPEWLHRFDYEAELVIVIGKKAWNISKEKAVEHIFGYTCGNDLSARDGQFLSTQWLSGKGMPGFGPVGPLIVTSDSFKPDDEHKVSCQVNGNVVQSGVTTDMIFNCAEIVSTASRYFKLDIGDLIFTGTPAGVIMGREKDKQDWLKAGDVVTVTIDGIGTLETPLV